MKRVKVKAGVPSFKAYQEAAIVPLYLRRIAMVVLSKPVAAGVAERNWADTKTIWGKNKAVMTTDMVVKRQMVYSYAHRSPLFASRKFFDNVGKVNARILDEESFSYNWEDHCEPDPGGGSDPPSESVRPSSEEFHRNFILNIQKFEALQKLKKEDSATLELLERKYIGVWIRDSESETPECELFEIRGVMYSTDIEPNRYVVRTVAREGHPEHGGDREPEYQINKSLHECVAAAIVENKKAGIQVIDVS